MAGHILLAEDDKALSALMQDFFRAAGVAVTPAYDGEQALVLAQAQPFDLLVLDEACAAHKNALVDEQLLRTAAARAKADAEVVLTGREPAAWMQDAADYSTEMRAVKHPYARGVTAREGVEY